MRDPRVIEAANKLIDKYGLDADKLSVKMPQAILIHIASCIRNWSDIAPYLGFAIEDFEEVFQNSGSEKSKKLFVFEKWSSKLGEAATFGQLIEIFLVAEREDLAERVCEYYAIWNKEKSHQKIHHPLMYTLRGRPTKRFDIRTARANMISKHRPLVKKDRVTVFDEVRQNGSHDPAAVRVIQIEDDVIVNGRRKGNKRRCAEGCGLCVYCFILLLFGLLSAAAFTLAYIIVIPLPHPPYGETLLIRDSPVLIGRLKPFYTHSADIHIMNINVTAAQNDTEELRSNTTVDYYSSGDTLNNAHPIVEYYQMRCNDLRTLNTTVDIQGAVPISTGHTHILYEGYLVAGSTINFHFQFEPHLNTTLTDQGNTSVFESTPSLSEDTTSTTEATPTNEAISVPKHMLSSLLEHTEPLTIECATELLIFNDDSDTEDNMDNSEASTHEQPQRIICIQNITHKQQQQQQQTYNFTLLTPNSSHQTVKVIFKSSTAILDGMPKSLNYEITGTQVTFDLDQHQPTCVTTPTNQSSCTLRFSNYHIYRFSEEDCMLGHIANASHFEQVGIKYRTTNNEYVMIMHYILVGLGLVFIIVFSGLVSGCISMCNCG